MLIHWKINGGCLSTYHVIGQFISLPPTPAVEVIKTVPSGFVGPALCTTSWVQDYELLRCAPPICIVHHQPALRTMTSCNVMEWHQKDNRRCSNTLVFFFFICSFLSDWSLSFIVWQRFCEPSPDLGFPTVRACVCVCLSVCLDRNSKPIPSSFQPKTVNQTFQGPKSTCSARHCRLQVRSF